MNIFRNIHKYLLAAMILLPFTAQAVYVDFTDSTGWSPAPGTTSSTQKTVDGITITVSALVDGGAGTLYWDNTDGYGIRGGEEDEIDARNERIERLRVNFSSPIAQLSRIDITDLFYEPTAPQYFEYGYYKIDDGAWTIFVQDDMGKLPSPTSNGEFSILTSYMNVSDIYFRAYIGGDNLPNEYGPHEFSVGGIEIVPEPGTYLMLGSLLIIVAMARKKKRLIA